MFDSVESKARKGTRTRNYWFDWFEAFKEPEHEEQIGQLRTIRAESGQHHLSLLRVLDIILWMHRPLGSLIRRKKSHQASTDAPGNDPKTEEADELPVKDFQENGGVK
ncbi:hypothetical protein [Citricoccus nitrophenolicus]|uniref:hypothetical protein n=1 Tax=Citricoccus nitrophenolicus TaxID=863575 RepID=UPI0039B633B2